MPKGTDISSILVIGAALALSSCSRPDWREGIEKPEDCIARVSEGGEGLFSQPAAQKFMWVPTFTFDITMMDQEARQELLASNASASQEAADASVTSEGEVTIGTFTAEMASASVVVGDPILYTMQDDPVAIASSVAAGCALQRPDMRLVSLTIKPPASADGNANETSAETESETEQ